MRCVGTSGTYIAQSKICKWEIFGCFPSMGYEEEYSW